MILNFKSRIWNYISLSGFAMSFFQIASDTFKIYFCVKVSWVNIQIINVIECTFIFVKCQPIYKVIMDFL